MTAKTPDELRARVMAMKREGFNSAEIAEAIGTTGRKVRSM